MKVQISHLNEYDKAAGLNVGDVVEAMLLHGSDGVFFYMVEAPFDPKRVLSAAQVEVVNEPRP